MKENNYKPRIIDKKVNEYLSVFGAVCIETGGIPEMIDHLKNGYVAKYKDTNDLAVGIKWIIDNQETFRFSEACVRKVHDCYRESVIAEKYIALYQSLCNKRK